LADCDAIERELRTLTPVEDRSKELDKLAKFLANVVDAWDEATQGQRNKLTKILVEDNKVTAVKPRPELEPFFKLSYECHAKDIACDPEGNRGRQYLQYIWDWGC